MVWVARKSQERGIDLQSVGKIFKTGVDNAAVEGYFYARSTEEWFANEIENPMGSLWDRLNFADIPDLSMEERLTVARFILAQAMRNDASKAHLDEMLNWAVDSAINENRLLLQGRWIMDARAGIYVPARVSTQRRFSGEETLQESWADILRPTEDFEGNAKLLAGSRWVLWHATGEEEFIISDDPVKIRRRSMKDGLVCETFVMAVGRRYAIEINSGVSDAAHYRHWVGDTSVQWLNAAIATQSGQIIAHSRGMVERYARYVGRRLLREEGDLLLPVSM